MREALLLLYTARVAVHDFCGRLMRRDRLIALLALAAGVGAVLLVLGSDRERSPAAASAALALVVGWAYIGSGLIARRQRPENRLGTVMVFIGFAWFATFLADAGSSLVFTLGTARRVDLPARLRLSGAVVSDGTAARARSTAR